jgi:2-succinyl-6-hydroxy-2,4-cyclohexadiene-1-carboxylate synthase
MAFVGVNGLAFHVIRRGGGVSEPLVLLHGFTGSAASWHPLLDRLGEGIDSLTIDVIGHGKSSAPEEIAPYRFETALNDLAAVTARLGITRAAWLGYSLGGRLALGLTLRHPNLVSRLILESATPGVADPADRAARRAADERLARHIEEAGVAVFVAEWERLPLWESQRGLPASVLTAQRAIRLANVPIGLANSLRGMGQGAQPSLWDRLGDVRAPVLIVTGDLDRKFTAIGERMRAALPNAQQVLAPDAGHAVHLEAPDFLATQVVDFLAESDVVASRAGQEKIAWT